MKISFKMAFMKHILVVICIVFISDCVVCNETGTLEEALDLARKFKEIDTDNNRKITPQEVSVFLAAHKVGYPVESDNFKELVRHIIEGHDANNDGLVSYDEFVPKHDEL